MQIVRDVPQHKLLMRDRLAALRINIGHVQKNIRILSDLAEREFQRLLAAGRDIRLQFPCFLRQPVFRKRPLHGDIIRVAEAVGIAEGIGRRIHLLCAQGAVDLFHLQCARVRRAVGIEKTIHTEVAVVHLFTVVAAVGVCIFIFFVVLAVVHRMVAPFPNAAAHQLIA